MTSRNRERLQFSLVIATVFPDNHTATIDITTDMRLSEAFKDQIRSRLKQRSESRLVLPHEILKEPTDCLHDVFVLSKHRKNLAEQIPVPFEVAH